MQHSTGAHWKEEPNIRTMEQPPQPGTLGTTTVVVAVPDNIPDEPPTGTMDCDAPS